MKDFTWDDLSVMEYVGFYNSVKGKYNYDAQSILDAFKERKMKPPAPRSEAEKQTINAMYNIFKPVTLPTVPLEGGTLKMDAESTAQAEREHETEVLRLATK